MRLGVLPLQLLDQGFQVLADGVAQLLDALLQFGALLVLRFAPLALGLFAPLPLGVALFLRAALVALALRRPLALLGLAPLRRLALLAGFALQPLGLVQRLPQRFARLLERAEGAAVAAFLQRERDLPKQVLHLGDRFRPPVDDEAGAGGAQREIGGDVVLEGLGRGGDRFQVGAAPGGAPRGRGRAPCARRSPAARRGG